jgi:signal transduction histidine kinase
MASVPPPITGLTVDLLGFLTGVVLYAMLIAMVWRERAGEAMPFLARRGRLPLLTGVCGLIWNLGALASFGTQVTGHAQPQPFVVALAFGALGFLPAVVVHSLLEGREAEARRRLDGLAIGLAYLLSATAAILQLAAAWRLEPVPSRVALWLLTGGFVTLTGLLLFVTRQQPIGRRGVWVAALSIFAVSALHFGRHVGNEVWWVDLVGHHASLLLALTILHQDYRFALADLFVKNAIALLLLMSISLSVFAGANSLLWRWQDPGGAWDPRAVALFVALGMGTALTFPMLRRLAGRFVDRAVLQRPDYEVTLSEFGKRLESADSEGAVAQAIVDAAQMALGVSKADTRDDPFADSDRRVVVSGPALRGYLPGCALLLRLRTVDAPHPGIAFGALSAGRRLLSDDVRLLEAIARLAARRLDSLRVTRERLAHTMREREMQRLATEAELRALRAQLHPHFLFNALTTVGYLIEHAPSRALETLLRLTTVLRSVLQRSAAEFSTVGEEIDLIRSYLDIERARFEERLKVRIDIAPSVRDIAIPTLLLQPLVENAIKHGVGQRTVGGEVRLAAYRRDHLLHIVVEDSGVGFDATRIGVHAGVGLRSVAERLRVHYGNVATLHVDSAVGRGTIIEIDLPVEGQHDVRRRAV